MVCIELPDGAVSWLSEGERGASSDTLFSITTGLVICKQKYFSYPSDPSDFRRCQLLLQAAPELRERLSMLKKISPEWNALVDHWDEINAAIENDVPGYLEPQVKGRAPNGYRLMKELIQKAHRDG